MCVEYCQHLDITRHIVEHNDSLQYNRFS